MFAILVPVSLLPLIATLLWAERKAKKMGIVQVASQPKASIGRRTMDLFDKMNFVGLALLGASVALILLPLTLSKNAKGGWHNRRCFLRSALRSNLTSLQPP